MRWFKKSGYVVRVRYWKRSGNYEFSIASDRAARPLIQAYRESSMGVAELVLLLNAQEVSVVDVLEAIVMGKVFEANHVAVGWTTMRQLALSVGR